MDEIRRIAVSYADCPQIPGDLRTPIGARGKCSTVSEHLVVEYRTAGHKACRIRFKGHRHDVPIPRPEGDDREEHIAVLVDGVVVDITRRQFDPNAEVPTIYATVDAAGRDWCEVFDDDTGHQPRPLPSVVGGRALDTIENAGDTASGSR